MENISQRFRVGVLNTFSNEVRRRLRRTILLSESALLQGLYGFNIDPTVHSGLQLRRKVLEARILLLI